MKEVRKFTAEGNLDSIIVHYSEHETRMVNGVEIPIGHYWQSGKIHPVMKKPKVKKKAARK